MGSLAVRGFALESWRADAAPRVGAGARAGAALSRVHHSRRARRITRDRRLLMRIVATPHPVCRCDARRRRGRAAWTPRCSRRWSTRRDGGRSWRGSPTRARSSSPPVSSPASFLVRSTLCTRRSRPPRSRALLESRWGTAGCPRVLGGKRRPRLRRGAVGFMARRQWRGEDGVAPGPGGGRVRSPRWRGCRCLPRSIGLLDELERDLPPGPDREATLERLRRFYRPGVTLGCGVCGRAGRVARSAWHRLPRQRAPRREGAHGAAAGGSGPSRQRTGRRADSPCRRAGIARARR